jgi:hypothetical protein
MTGNIEKGALILSIGIVLGAIIVAVSMSINATKLSTSLVDAGERSRSHSSTSFPSELRVQVSETSMDLPAEKKSELQNAFVKACVGQMYDNKTIKEVKINTFKAAPWRSNLYITGNIVFDDGSMHKGYQSYLYRDGFGGYQGYVRTKDGNHLIVKNIHIQ